MEVGAMLVGKIENYHEEADVVKGQEKGRFLYGGSTIILLLEPEKVKLPKKIFEETRLGNEVNIKMGQKIGVGNICS
jgi:phosphatidylserine decarboxylase